MRFARHVEQALHGQAVSKPGAHRRPTFDRIDEASVVTGTRHPRNNPAWPRVGIFAQRASRRPNRLGVTIVAIIGREGSRLRVRGLDAADGTPVVDIKPVMTEFLPREPVRQPGWSHDLMRGYWQS